MRDLSIGLSACFFLGITLFSQDEIHEGRNDDKAMREYIRDVVQEELTGVSTAYTQVLIEDIARTLGLSDADSEKLRVAGKGAAISASSDFAGDDISPLYDNLGWIDQIAINGRRFFGPGQTEAEVKLLEDTKLEQITSRLEVKLHERQLTANYKHKQGSTSVGTSSGLRKILKESKWERIYTKIVDKEDDEQYQDSWLGRRRSALANIFVNYWTLHLRLDDDQTSAIHDWLITTKLLDSFSPGDHLNLIKQCSESVNEDRFRDFLTEAQFDLWRIRIQAMRRSSR